MRFARSFATCLLCIALAAAPLPAEDLRSDYAAPPPPEPAVLSFLDTPAWRVAGVTAAALGLGGCTVLAGLGISGLVANAGLGPYHPAFQEAAMGTVAGMALAGIFAAALDVLLRLPPPVLPAAADTPAAATAETPATDAVAADPPAADGAAGQATP